MVDISAWVPSTQAERDAIREQMERIFVSPLFRNSKRYPALLRFVVNAALDGQAGHLKERTIGIEVFGRTPDYDTNIDPVVRTTAVEIRKRINQYYSEPGHESEIRIALPAGSYVPEFHLPKIIAPPDIAPVQVSSPQSISSRRRPLWILAGALLAIAAAGTGFWSFGHPQITATDLFWRPVWNSPSPVLLLIGRASRGMPPGTPVPTKPIVTMVDLMASESVAFADATTLAQITGLLTAKHKLFHIRRFSSAKFDDLRDGPAVLIGGFNNDWTLRLNSQLRYHFERDQAMSWISDRQNPTDRRWSVDLAAPYTSVSEDFGVISRVEDPTTGRLVVTAAGLTKFGTAAAGEFLSDPKYLAEVAKDAPLGWDRKNIQVLISTHLVGESSGPPRILATYFW